MADKIIFWINNFLLHYFLANELRGKCDSEFYAIIDVSNRLKEFFTEQQSVDFKQTWYYNDHIKKKEESPDIEYLRTFEKKYKINLWKLAINERIFYRFNRLYKFSTNEILIILEQECKLFERIIDEIKPDYFLTYDPPLHHQKLFHDLCIAKGVKVLGMYTSRVGQGSIIAENGEDFDFPNTLKNIKESGRNFKELKKHKDSLDYSDTTKNYLVGRNKSKTEQLKALSEYILFSDSMNTKTHYSYYGRNKIKVILDASKFSIGRKYRKQFVDKNLEKEIDLNVPFVYFPLSVDEEMNVLHYAPFYTNQIEVIRHIAKSLPIEYTLFVKEHPFMEIRGWRSTSEYKEILDIPNLRLLHPTFPTEELYKKCSLLITIRGTSAFDVTFFEKPSIIFGNLPFGILPSVHKLQSVEELPLAISKSLQKKVVSSDLDKYLNLIESKSIDFDLLGFENIVTDFFYSGGILSDINISQSKMKEFLEKYKKQLGYLADEHIKKISLDF